MLGWKFGKMGGVREGEVIRTLTVCSVLGCRGIPPGDGGAWEPWFEERICVSFLMYGCRAVCLVLWCVAVPQDPANLPPSI